MDYEWLHFDINEDDLLDQNEGVFMVDTKSSLHHEQILDIITCDADVEKDEVSNSTQHLLAKL